MAPHARRVVLEQVQSLLSFADTRLAPMFNVARQPAAAAVSIDWTNELVECRQLMGAPLQQQRTLTVQVVVLRQTIDDDVDQAADLDAEQLERELQSETLGGLVRSWRLTNVTKDLDGSGERPVARLTHTYEAIYFTRADAPGTIVT